MLHQMDLLTHTFRVPFPFCKLTELYWCTPFLVLLHLEVASRHLGPLVLATDSSPFSLALSWSCAQPIGSPRNPYSLAEIPGYLMAGRVYERQHSHHLAFSC